MAQFIGNSDDKRRNLIEYGFGINYCLDKWPDSEYTVLANNDLLFMSQ